MVHLTETLSRTPTGWTSLAAHLLETHFGLLSQVTGDGLPQAVPALYLCLVNTGLNMLYFLMEV